VKPSGNTALEMVVDIFISINIVFSFITAFQRDMKTVKNIWEIFKNYAFGTMIFDIAATVPGFFTNTIPGLYWFKLIRFVHVRAVYGTITYLV